MCLVESTVVIDLSTSVHGKDLLEGLLPGISSFQPRDMSFSGVNADTFSASIFTETFSLPSSKTEEIANWTSMHPISSLCLSVLYTSDVTTSQRKFHNFHQFNHVAWFYHAPNISPAIYTQCLTISSRPPTVSLHVHQSSRVVVLCPEPNKGLEVWSPTGLAITPHRVAPKRWQLWSKILIAFACPICKHSNKTSLGN